MTLTDEELTLYAMREAHLILAAYIEPGGAQDADKTIQELLEVLDRTDVVEAVERLVAKTGMRFA